MAGGQCVLYVASLTLMQFKLALNGSQLVVEEQLSKEKSLNFLQTLFSDCLDSERLFSLFWEILRWDFRINIHTFKTIIIRKNIFEKLIFLFQVIPLIKDSYFLSKY